MRRTMYFALSLLLLLYDCQSAAYPRKLKIMIAKASCTIFFTWKLGYYRIFVYSRALSSTASSCTDLEDARFWIGSKNIWDERIYVVKNLSSTVFWSSCFYSMKLQKLHEFWAALFFSFPKKRASQGLTV